MEIGKIYKLDNELIKLTKIHKNGIHIFQVVDQFGEEIIIRNANVIKDYGTRVVRARLSQDKEVEKAEYSQLNLF